VPFSFGLCVNFFQWTNASFNPYVYCENAKHLFEFLATKIELKPYGYTEGLHIMNYLNSRGFKYVTFKGPIHLMWTVLRAGAVCLKSGQIGLRGQRTDQNVYRFLIGIYVAMYHRHGHRCRTLVMGISVKMSQEKLDTIRKGIEQTAKNI